MIVFPCETVCHVDIKEEQQEADSVWKMPLELIPAFWCLLSPCVSEMAKQVLLLVCKGICVLCTLLSVQQ